MRIARLFAEFARPTGLAVAGPASLAPTRLALRYALTAALLVAAAVALLGSATDPDLWGHVRFGRDIIASRSLPVTDHYSFTSDRPWINHEWLSEVLMAIAFEGNALGLNLLRVSTIAVVLALVWARLHNLDLLLRTQLVAAAAIGILWRVLPMRPQVFSVLFFATMLWAICRADERNSIRPICLLPAVMLAWANMHGGWIVGGGVFACWALARVLGGRAPSNRPAALLMLGVVSLLATLINPYGLGLWRFLAETVRMDRAMISDWAPLHTMPFGVLVGWFVSAAIAAAAAFRRARPVDRTYVAIIALLGLAAIRVSRLDAFFALAAVFFAGPSLERAARSTLEELPQMRRLSRAIAAVALIVILAAATWRLPSIPIPDASSPEPEATRFIHSRRLEGRMLTWFDWGEYAIWHLSPRIRVSMDGRRETVYTDTVNTEHIAFYKGAKGATEYPERIGADYIWLPRRLPVVRQLQASGWRAAFEGPVSVVLTRSARIEAVRSNTPQGHRGFPDM